MIYYLCHDILNLLSTFSGAPQSSPYVLILSEMPLQITISALFYYAFGLATYQDLRRKQRRHIGILSAIGFGSS